MEGGGCETAVDGHFFVFWIAGEGRRVRRGRREGGLP